MYSFYIFYIEQFKALLYLKDVHENNIPTINCTLEAQTKQQYYCWFADLLQDDFLSSLYTTSETPAVGDVLYQYGFKNEGDETPVIMDSGFRVSSYHDETDDYLTTTLISSYNEDERTKFWRASQGDMEDDVVTEFVTGEPLFAYYEDNNQNRFYISTPLHEYSLLYFVPGPMQYASDLSDYDSDIYSIYSVSEEELVFTFDDSGIGSDPIPRVRDWDLYE